MLERFKLTIELSGCPQSGGRQGTSKSIVNSCRISPRGELFEQIRGSRRTSITGKRGGHALGVLAKRGGAQYFLDRRPQVLRRALIRRELNAGSGFDHAAGDIGLIPVSRDNDQRNSGS